MRRELIRALYKSAALVAVALFRARFRRIVMSAEHVEGQRLVPLACADDQFDILN
jgi:hypothetical protein